MKMKLKNYWTLLFVVLLVNTTEVMGQTSPTNMSWIPPGNFQMGNTFSGEGYFDELPLHTVYVSGFYMDKYEVTKTLWDNVYQWATNHGYNFNNVGSGKASTHPIHAVSWYDCVKWCNARSEKEGKTPAYYTSAAQTTVYRLGTNDLANSFVNWNAGYRLPTEAEWEKAARGGTSGHRFPWKDTDNITHTHANYISFTNYTYDTSLTRGHHPSFNTGSFPYTSPVGYFAPNGYDLYDMAGNIREWCWDWYDWFSYYSNGLQIDPRGPTSGIGTFGPYRVLRGGSWGGTAEGCRSSGNRGINNPSHIQINEGFRTVLPSTISFEEMAVLNTPATQEVYSCSITRQPGRTNLIVVTHGWIRKEIGQTFPPNPDWVDEMTNKIQNYLTSHNLTSWQVAAFKWKDKAWLGRIDAIGKGNLLDNADKEGGELGKTIANQGWSHFHFYSHSGGAAVSQSATEIIKGVNANTFVHETFLDPYIGFTYGGKSRYGLMANWADNYFAYDTETFDGLVGRTYSRLDHAYNVEVTWLDPNKFPLIGVYRSTAGGGTEECFETDSSHEWPHEFYANTILPNTQTGSQGFGFPLSKEGGGWNFATNNYHTYGDPTRVLGTPDEPCFLGHDLSVPTYPPWLVDFSQTSVTSVTGFIENDGLQFTLSAGAGASQFSPLNMLKANVADSSSTPAWLLKVFIVTNKINSVSFYSQFTSASGAEGILSAYLYTNSLGTIDERVVVPGLRHYTYLFPQTVTNGTYTIGFKLDSFTNVLSSVTVTNVTLGFVGTPNPFSLSFTGKYTNGFPMFKLTGPSGFNYTIETSTNLIDWTPTANLINTTNGNGTVSFVDRTSTNSRARFYRAVGY